MTWIPTTCGLCPTWRKWACLVPPVRCEELNTFFLRLEESIRRDARRDVEIRLRGLSFQDRVQERENERIA